ncbi:MAG: hypothetical protein OXB86_06795 [Bdellovibrionales bacterium]|nr:hypothetical protein [Bdellovibrionales bacterium]
MSLKNSPIPLWSETWARKKKIPYQFFLSTESVNNSAKEAAFKDFASPSLFIARSQTAGRGRHQKTWEDSDLMMAWLWEGAPTEYDVSGLDEKLAENLFYTVQKIWPSPQWKLKKPNDLYLKNQKTAGILLEVLDQKPKRALIAGMGFNIFSHPPVPKAGHLGLIVSNILQNDWNRFLDQLNFLWTEKAKKCLNF